MRASGQARWIRAVEAHPDFASLRADALSNLLAIAWVLARSADWTSLTTRPTWPRVMRTAGIRRSTLAKDLRLLRDAGLLGVVETGSTPLFRPGVLHGPPRDAEGNRAAEYVLCVPRPPDSQDHRRVPVDETRTPSGFRQEAGYAPPHAREDSHPRGEPWTATVTPGTRGDMLAAAQELQRRCPLLARITARHLRSLLREWWRAGWTPADVLDCLDHRPTGALWPHTDRVRFVAGWVRFRLSAWRAEDGSPLSSPSQQRAADHEQVRAEQARRTAEWAAMRSRAVAPARQAEHVAAARRLLRAHSPAAARAIDRSALAGNPVHDVAHRRAAGL